MIEVNGLQLRVGDRKHAGRSFALRDVNLSVGVGEYFVLLGKSGSGKTLLLESLCGLNRIDAGTIHIGGRDVTQSEPRLRGIGYLPQDYALFPHRTVFGNVGYGLFGRRPGGEARRDATAALLAQLNIEHLADRYPARLSGGEKQRVALARALAIEPQLLLLDEPVSALDEQTRDALCRQLKQFQKSRGTTTIHVCHNFAEMLQVADRVAVMDRGSIVQTGTPQDILQRPATLDVARLAQPGNLFLDEVAVQMRSDGPWLRISEKVEFAASLPKGAAIRGKSAVMIREENLRLVRRAPDADVSRIAVLPVTLQHVEDLGALVRLTCLCQDRVPLVATQSKNEFKTLAIAEGDEVFVVIDPQDVHLIPVNNAPIST